MVYLYFDKENSEKDDGTNKEGKLKIVKPISLLQLHDLNIAIRVNRQDLVTYILCQNEYLNLNSCLIRSPPIALAVQSRNPCVVKLLLDHGCDVNKLFEYEIGTYETPLNYACRHGDYEIVKLLLQHNADPNITNIDHCSPLLNAAREGFHEICTALIKYKANLNMPEKNGQTPLHMACKYFYRSYKSAEILIAHGAKSTQPDFKRRLCTDMICFSDSFTNEEGEEVLLIGQNFIEQKNVIGMLFDSGASFNKQTVKREQNNFNNHQSNDFENDIQNSYNISLLPYENLNLQKNNVNWLLSFINKRLHTPDSLKTICRRKIVNINIHNQNKKSKLNASCWKSLDALSDKIPLELVNFLKYQKH